jgi:hypothetical protein
MRLRSLVFSTALVLASTWALPALAGPRDVWLLPTRVEAPNAPVDLEAVARRLDDVLGEAVQDFGFTLERRTLASEPDETALTSLATSAWVVEPRLALSGDALVVRLAVVPYASQVLLVRAQRLEPAEVEVRTLGMLRELIEPATSRSGADCVEATTEASASASASVPVRSEGKAVLALHAAALGGYLGFSLQRASGSDDARLTYPLAALGAGVGLGSAVIVSDEWDINVARAWFLGAAITWPTAGMLLLEETDAGDPPGQRNLMGLVGAVGGLTLATAGLTLGDVTEGGAALTHSGAGMGLLLGGLAQMAIEGDAEITPRRGMGFGTLTGVLLAGAVATQFDVPSSTDILFVDLSALLGGLAGAALGTPVLVSQDASPTRDRIWLSGVMAGTITGAAVGYWVTQSDDPSASAAHVGNGAEVANANGFHLRPQLGWMGMPLGAGVSGDW